MFGTFIAYIYSAPPLKLKAVGWAGSFALGSSYISLPWLCGQAMFGELSWPVTVLTIFYSLAGLGIIMTTLSTHSFNHIVSTHLYRHNLSKHSHIPFSYQYYPLPHNLLVWLGIAIVNDFKSIEGDRALGLQSLPVAFGVEAAKWLTVGTIDLTQLAVAAYLFYIGETTYALVCDTFPSLTNTYSKYFFLSLLTLNTTIGARKTINTLLHDWTHSLSLTTLLPPLSHRFSWV